MKSSITCAANAQEGWNSDMATIIDHLENDGDRPLAMEWAISSLLALDSSKAVSERGMERIMSHMRKSLLLLMLDDKTQVKNAIEEIKKARIERTE